jgi:glycosyltransferase involved in cell wall biosynthesis
MVGISLLTLVPGVVGGQETYVRELTRTLARVGELDYRVFVPTIAPDVADGLPSREVTAYRASTSMPGRMAAMSLAAAYPRPVLRELELSSLDAVHFPLTVMLPRVRRPPAVTSMHDVQHFYFPRFFSRAELAYRAVVYRWTARLSRRLITGTEHAKVTLVERLGVEPDRVRVIPYGIDHERFRPDGREREPFLLYPANPWPHKNHERLFEAFALVRAKRPELRLVLTGHGHAAEAPPGVEVRGHVSLEELADLYRSAAALVFPSLYEGFGFPPLEAMASGCPVAVSTAGSLLEICGDAARTFDPTSVEEMAEAIEDVLDHPEPWAACGLERARAFDWETCARRHEAVYRELAS